MTGCPNRSTGSVGIDPLLGHPHHPALEPASGDSERHLVHHADAITAAAGQRKGKEGEDRSGVPVPVTVIEVIGSGIVKIDRLLDQSQAKNTRVEVDVGLRVDRDRRHMVQAGNGR